MLGAIHMPQWLVDFWTVYGDMITPVLVTLAVSLLTYLALQIKTNAKINSAKADLQIEALKEVANREDNKPQLEEQSIKITELENTIINLAEMVNLAFQNSALDPAIKESLAALSNKIKYGTEIDLIKQYEEKEVLYLEKIEELKKQLEKSTTITVVEPENRKRTRR